MSSALTAPSVQQAKMLVTTGFLPAAIKTPEQAVAFASRVDKSGDCWLWTGGKLRHGYGTTRIDGKTYLTHRVAYELSHGTIPVGWVVCHRCDNPTCVRPSHLFAGTQADNLADMVRKGRQTAGERNPHARLDRATVQDIRERYARGNVTQRHLARTLGVAQSLISKIVNYRAWRNDSEQ